jgi:hypothetical protein
MSKFKVGDWVEVLDDGYLSQAGGIGIVQKHMMEGVVVRVLLNAPHGDFWFSDDNLKAVERE